MPEYRRLPVPSLARLEGQVCGLVGGGSLEDGVHDSLSCTASPVCDSHHSRVLFPSFHQGEGFGGGDPGSSGEGCYRTCISSTRLLQPYVCSSQGDRWMETDNRSLGPQPLCCQDKVSHGDHPVGSQVSQEGRLDGLHRLEGCVSPSPYASFQSQVPEICRREQGLAIQGAVFRSHHSPPSLYKGDGSGLCHFTPVRDKNLKIPGRLADSGSLRGSSHSGKGYRDTALSGAGDSSQFGQVKSDSISEVGVSGSSDRFSEFCGFSDESTNYQVLINSRRISVLQGTARDILEGSSRVSGVPGFSSSRGTPQDEVDPGDPQEELGLLRRDSQGLLGRFLSGRPSLVVRRGSTSDRDVFGDRATRPNVLVRRLGRGVGRQSVGPVHLWHLVGRGGPSLHQRQGAVGGGEGSSRFRRVSLSQSSGDLLRQYHGSLLSQEAGGDSLSSAQFSCTEDSPVGRGEGYLSASSICDGVSQCGGGLPVQTQSSYRFRVDSDHGGIRVVEKKVASDYRPICHLSQSPLFCVFCAGVGSHVCGYRCHAPVMGSSPSLCLSSSSHGKAGSKQTENLEGDGSDSHCSLLETAGMVPRPSGVSVGTSTSSSYQEGSVASTAFSQISSKPCHAKPSCLETVERFARAAGFSSKVARQLARSRRRSSLDSYQAKWSIYRKWCISKGHSLSNPSVPKTADFLLWLFQEKSLSLPTIKAYRSMLSAVFKFKIPSLGNDPFIRDLIRSFEVQNPRSPQSFPSWDLNKVLSFLMSSQFEPLQDKDLRTMTMKVLFLVSLATAKRVSELHALSKVVPLHGQDMVLSYLSSFIAKTETVINPIPRSFLLKSLVDFAGDLPEGPLLCPVRALRIYLDKTKDMVSRPKSLFVSPKRPSQGISKNAISYFLRRVIVDSGAVGGNEGPPPRAHSIRGVATSVAFLKNCNIARVLEAATWRSNSVFSLFYFKDIQYVLDECKSLGPFVAAGAVVS